MNSKPFPSQKAYSQAVEKALAAAKAYYLGIEPIIDDASYDELLFSLIETESLHPDWISENSPVGKVAAGVSDIASAGFDPTKFTSGTFNPQAATFCKLVL